MTALGTPDTNATPKHRPRALRAPERRSKIETLSRSDRPSNQVGPSGQYAAGMSSPKQPRSSDHLCGCHQLGLPGSSHSRPAASGRLPLESGLAHRSAADPQQNPAKVLPLPQSGRSITLAMTQPSGDDSGPLTVIAFWIGLIADQLSNSKRPDRQHDQSPLFPYVKTFELHQREFRFPGRLKLRLPSGATRLQASPPAIPLSEHHAKPAQHEMRSPKRVERQGNCDDYEHHERQQGNPSELRKSRRP